MSSLFSGLLGSVELSVAFAQHVIKNPSMGLFSFWQGLALGKEEGRGGSDWCSLDFLALTNLSLRGGHMGRGNPESILGLEKSLGLQAFAQQTPG